VTTTSHASGRPSTADSPIHRVDLRDDRRATLVACNSSNGALIDLTRQLAIEYAPHGIRVNWVCPGWIETGLNDPVLGHLSPTELGQLVEQQVPLGRQGTADDIAPSVAFLATDWARYITGQALPIDGGLTST
jgi:NAD(P)-dependent dehydrogenase (short-subunit alcohol dehydrogenase family)